jgi:putative protein-disulfide isomerase
MVTGSDTRDVRAIDPRHLLYIADPMCSWCYGFAPAITAIAAHFSGGTPVAGGKSGHTVPVRVLVGGLRAGNTRRMRETDKDFLRGAWTRVAAATGQPFGYKFFDREGFVYDTEPACRAIVAMRERAPAATLAYMARISRAFYAETRDTTSLDVLAALAAEFGQDRHAFRFGLDEPELKAVTLRDFTAVSEAGIQGFPTLLASGADGTYALVTNGYRPLDGLIPAIESWASGLAMAARPVT